MARAQNARWMRRLHPHALVASGPCGVRCACVATTTQAGSAHDHFLSECTGHCQKFLSSTAHACFLLACVAHAVSFLSTTAQVMFLCCLAPVQPSTSQTTISLRLHDDTPDICHLDTGTHGERALLVPVLVVAARQPRSSPTPASQTRSRKDCSGWQPRDARGV